MTDERWRTLYGAAITLFVVVLVGTAGLGVAVMKVLARSDRARHRCA